MIKQPVATRLSKSVCERCPECKFSERCLECCQLVSMTGPGSGMKTSGERLKVAVSKTPLKKCFELTM